MKYVRSFILLSLVIIIAFGCNEENKTDGEIQKNDNQVLQENNQNKQNQQKIEVMTTFTPEEEIIKEKVMDVIRKNLAATQAEDVEGVLATIHEDSPQLSSTREGMEYVFKNFDMAYELEDAKFISITNEEVKVIYQQTTKAVKGTGFKNTRTIGIHTLRKSKDGSWKIYKTDFVSSGVIQ
jgi:ketosteroid isomerase-like protein